MATRKKAGRGVDVGRLAKRVRENHERDHGSPYRKPGGPPPPLGGLAGTPAPVPPSRTVDIVEAPPTPPAPSPLDVLAKAAELAALGPDGLYLLVARVLELREDSAPSGRILRAVARLSAEAPPNVRAAIHLVALLPLERSLAQGLEESKGDHGPQRQHAEAVYRGIHAALAGYLAQAGIMPPAPTFQPVQPQSVSGSGS